MSKGHVYILTNERMPGIVKIGKTTGNPDVRASQIYTTGVPVPFKVSYFVTSPDCDELELILHEKLQDCRVSSGREFFEIELAKAIEALELEHFALVGSWLSEFVGRMAVDPIDVAFTAMQTGHHPFDVASCVTWLDGIEISAALGRKKAGKAQSNLKVVS